MVRAVRARRQRKELEPVAVVAELLLLGLGRLVVQVPVRRSGYNRVTPAQERHGGVTRRDDDVVTGVERDRGEGESSPLRRLTGHRRGGLSTGQAHLPASGGQHE